MLIFKPKVMLLNVSYTRTTIKDKINGEVGLPFPLFEGMKSIGLGSPKFHITSTSIDINYLLVLDNNANTCNVEMRPKGIIIMFRSLLETFALVIPYYKLHLYKGRAE